LSYKTYHLQLTQSFKLRGATDKVRLLAPDHEEVFTASTGNHGGGRAWPEIGKAGQRG